MLEATKTACGYVASFRNEAKVRFSADNRHTFALSEKVWIGKFDLALTHMTSAFVSAETFSKISEASRNWVPMVRPTRRTNSVLDALNSLVGITPPSRRPFFQTVLSLCRISFGLVLMCHLRNAANVLSDIVIPALFMRQQAVAAILDAFRRIG